MLRRKRRATSDEPIPNDEQLWGYLMKLCNKLEWPYKVDKDRLNQRDKALFAFIFLSGCRISEVIQVKRKQFSSFKDHIELQNVKPLKHGKLRRRIVLPKAGHLGDLTRLFEVWLNQVDDMEAYVFAWHDNAANFNFERPISRKTGYWIVKRCGLFPHWGRAVCETIYGRRVFKSDIFKLADFMGIKNVNSLTPYVQGSWEENEKDIYKL